MEAAFELELLDDVLDRPDRPQLEACTAELAECTCPDFCERDHTNE
ncbi:MAG TPA: hypothetical protein VLE97_01475 [Gaiellaceae bacterium]|nr:hypothetical protein [Gaiellaceae bacterium]